jgi:hypothetical protein
MSSKWEVVFVSKVAGSEQNKLLLRITKALEGKPTLIMDIREVANGRFTKTGVSLNLQEAKILLETLSNSILPGNHLCGGRRFNIKRNPNGMELVVVKADDSRQILFITRPDLNLIRPVVEEAMGYMESLAKEEIRIYMESQVKELGVEPM